MRSDIYSVGVTLYYLLTGKTPFQAENVVKLIATILEQAAASPTKLRPEIPKELSNVVLRCLGKQKEQRFKSYEELRQALLPFDSTTPVPAPPGLRFYACAVDGIIIFAPMFFTFLIVGAMANFVGTGRANLRNGFRRASWSGDAVLRDSGGLLGCFVGQSPLWTAGRGCKQAGAGIATGGAANVHFLLVINVSPNAVEWLMPDSIRHALPGQPGFVIRNLAGLLGESLVPFVALFCTARRKNGFASLHDLASRTRVVRKKAFQARPVAPAADPAQPLDETLPRIGPYHILATLDRTGGDELLLGYDTRLLRKVWMRQEARAPLAPRTPKVVHSPIAGSKGTGGRGVALAR